MDTDYLDQVEAQLVELTDRGAHHRVRARSGARVPRLRAQALAFGLAIAVVLAVVLVALGTLRPGGGAGSPAAPSHRHVHRSSPTPGRRALPPTRHALPPPPGGPALAPPRTAPGRAAPVGPVPPGFEPQSFTAISELTWWLMGTARCSRPPCTSIVRTTNGGVSFVGIPAPRAPRVSFLGRAAISELRFADAENGFAYGDALYVTHDAGRTWHALNLGGRVGDLAIAAGRAYAIVSTQGGRASRLMSSFVGQDDWTAVSPAGGVAGGLWARGSDVFVESADRGHVLVSHDQGVTFARYPAPGYGLGCDLQELSPPVVWAHCPTGMMSLVWRSTDGGATFQLASGVRGGPPQLELANSAAFAAASATTAVAGFQQLYRTVDGGKSYVPVGPTGIGSWQYLGFTDATHGVALGLGSQPGSRERLYYTTDGGLTYHLVSIR